MSDRKPSSPAELEAELLEKADDIFEKSASVLSPDDRAQFTQSEDDSRLEERAEEKTAASDDEGDTPRASKTRWAGKPSIRNQMVEQPNSVRYVNPETKILTLSNAEDLREFNRIQKEAADTDAPSLWISECVKQPYNGSWTVLITFHEVQYMQL